jgi:hypothetical protein
MSIGGERCNVQLHLVQPLDKIQQQAGEGISGQGVAESGWFDVFRGQTTFTLLDILD